MISCWLFGHKFVEINFKENIIHFFNHKIITTLENISKDVDATKKTKDFILYGNDGTLITKTEHLDKLFFAKEILDGILNGVVGYYYYYVCISCGKRKEVRL